LETHLHRLLAIAAGGALGAVCRYAVVLGCVRLLGDRFPYGVLAVNVAGCFGLGLLMHESWVSGDRLGLTAHAAMSVGLLGALTTFSTFGYDTVRLVELGRHGPAVLNVLANVGAGLTACWLGRLLGNSLWPT